MVRITDRRYMTGMLLLRRKTPTQINIIADILSKVFDKCSLSGIFCQNPSISLVITATERLHLRKHLRTIMAIKLKLCRHVHSIRLYNNIILVAIAYALLLLWQLMFP